MCSPRKSRKLRTAGTWPRREGNTACATPARSAQPGNTGTSKKDYVTDVFTDKALKFIEANRLIEISMSVVASTSETTPRPTTTDRCMAYGLE